MLEVRRLRLLRELSIRGTIAGVATSLSYSSSLISQQLAQLEQEVGAPLFQRSGRRLVLTPQAQLLVAHTEGILEAIERAEAAVASSLPTIRGSVRLAIIQTAGFAALPIALRTLRSLYPELRVELVHYDTGTALREILAGGFDLLVGQQYAEHATEHLPGLDRRDCARDTISLATSAHEDEIGCSSIQTLASAADKPWVLEPRGAVSRSWAEQVCRRAGFEPDVQYESEDLSTHVALVEAGHAVSMLPRLVTGFRPHRLRLIDLGEGAHRTLYTATRESGVDFPVIQAARDVIHDTLTDLLRPEDTPSMERP